MAEMKEEDEQKSRIFRDKYEKGLDNYLSSISGQTHKNASQGMAGVLAFESPSKSAVAK